MKTMNTKYFHIAIVICIFAVVPLGFAESYPNRPTAGGMEGLVVSGTQCARGVNERCWATQYQTNPVAYQVAPFTNTAGFYLDQSLMGTMAAKIKSLVLYYANPDTVYNGTTNISMYTVSGLFTELDIGDHTNQFTRTFASGTNAAVYGDSPWRICEDNLDERYDVLNTMEKRFLFDYTSDGTNFVGFTDYNKATFKGSSGGASQPGHLYYTFASGDLGPADNTEHTVFIDNRVLGAEGGNDYVSLGRAGGRVPAYDGKAMCIFLDEHEGGASESFLYSSSITFSDVVNIYNCWVIESYAWQSPSSSWTLHGATVSSTLTLPDGYPTAFFFQPILEFPFQYCK